VPAVVLALVGAAPWFVVLGLTSRGDSLAPAWVALVWLLALGLASGRATPIGRLDWLVPTVLEAAECLGVLRLAAVASDHDVAAGFAVAAVIAVRRYDIVYRPGIGAVSRVIGFLAGGWGLRLALACGLAAAGVVSTGYYAVAGALAGLLLGDAVLTWHDREWRRGAPAVAAAEEMH
jgi:hypothetical protein